MLVSLRSRGMDHLGVVPSLPDDLIWKQPARHNYPVPTAWRVPVHAPLLSSRPHPVPPDHGSTRSNLLALAGTLAWSSLALPTDRREITVRSLAIAFAWRARSGVQLEFGVASLRARFDVG